MVNTAVPRASKNALRPVSYAGITVRLYRRANGSVALKWREAGAQKETCKADEDRARAFASKKVRELANHSPGRLVTAAIAERIDWLDRLAGGPDRSAALLSTLEHALQTLGGAPHLLTEAALWYSKQGLASCTAVTVADAVTGFLKEYEARHPLSTVSPIRSTLRALSLEHGSLPLLELDVALLETFVRRGAVGPRTIRNRKSHLTTFFNRAEQMGWWPSGRKAPSVSIKRQRTPDKAPSIFTPPQGKAILVSVAKHKPRALPYLLIAGWLGCRPSECLRLDWSDFDWKNRLLHVRWEVARKTWRERWVPIKHQLVKILRPLSKDHGRVCRPRSREMITQHVAKLSLVTEWPADVLRHSYITFRLNEGGTHDEVAEESGNSPAIIRSDYRRPVPPGLGKQWFDALKAL